MQLAEVLETRYILIVCNKHDHQSWGAAFGFNTFFPPLVSAESRCEISGDVGDGAPQINLHWQTLALVPLLSPPCLG